MSDFVAWSLSGAAETVALSRSGEMALVTLDAPERANALNDSDIAAFHRCLDAIEAEPAVRALVITGRGTRAFSAGYDLGTLLGGERPEEPANLYPTLAKRVRAMRIATIAALNGPAVGAGCHLALSCDMRLATARTHMALPAAKLGFVYDPESIAAIRAELGSGLARQLLIGGLPLSAETLRSAGIVCEIVDAERLVARAVEIADKVLLGAPLAVAGFKALLAEIDRREFADELAALQARTVQSADRREAFLARKEKRRPNFSGS